MKLKTVTVGKPDIGTKVLLFLEGFDMPIVCKRVENDRWMLGDQSGYEVNSEGKKAIYAKLPVHNPVKERVDHEAVALLLENRFEEDALYVHTADLSATSDQIQAIYNENTFSRHVEQERNYNTLVRQRIAGSEKVYFVHPNGGIQLIKLQS